jgi:hypothetical protein
MDTRSVHAKIDGTRVAIIAFIRRVALSPAPRDGQELAGPRHTQIGRAIIVVLTIGGRIALIRAAGNLGMTAGAIVIAHIAGAEIAVGAVAVGRTRGYAGRVRQMNTSALHTNVVRAWIVIRTVDQGVCACAVFTRIHAAGIVIRAVESRERAFSVGALVAGTPVVVVALIVGATLGRAVRNVVEAACAVGLADIAGAQIAVVAFLVQTTLHFFRVGTHANGGAGATDIRLIVGAIAVGDAARRLQFVGAFIVLTPYQRATGCRWLGAVGVLDTTLGDRSLHANARLTLPHHTGRVGYTLFIGCTRHRFATAGSNEDVVDIDTFPLIHGPVQSVDSKGE